MNQLGKALIGMGLLLVAIGAVLELAGKLNIPFGKLPGDITYQRKNLTVFAPFGTMLVVSIVLSIIFNIFSRWK